MWEYIPKGRLECPKLCTALYDFHSYSQKENFEIEIHGMLLFLTGHHPVMCHTNYRHLISSFACWFCHLWIVVSVDVEDMKSPSKPWWCFTPFVLLISIIYQAAHSSILSNTLPENQWCLMPAVVLYFISSRISFFLTDLMEPLLWLW